MSVTLVVGLYIVSISDLVVLGHSIIGASPWSYVIKLQYRIGADDAKAPIAMWGYFSLNMQPTLRREHMGIC